MDIKRRLLFIFPLVAVSYVGIAALLAVFQSRFIYFPDKQVFDSCPGFSDAEKVNWNGTRMYVKRGTDKWVAFYHGNAGSACDSSFLKPMFEKRDYSYIFVEYAGYSGDTRTPSEKLLMQDVRNVNDYLQKQNPSSLVIIGESLGTALASYHASLTQPGALILVSPFNNLTTIGQQSFPYLPVRLLLKDKYDSDKWITGVRNVTILHGTGDEVIPISLSKKLFEVIKSPLKTFVEVPGAGHNDMYAHPRTMEILDNILTAAGRS